MIDKLISIREDLMKSYDKASTPTSQYFATNAIACVCMAIDYINGLNKSLENATESTTKNS